MSWRPPADDLDVVLACENPAVVAGVADRFGAAAPPVVCVDGMPSTAALLVLEQLSRDGHEIRYHGDFDWHGLTIAGVIARKLPMIKAWRYGAEDYERAIEAGLGALELSGRPSVSPWDDELAPAMAAAGRAVYEEQVLGDLLRDLEHDGRPRFVPVDELAGGREVIGDWQVVEFVRERGQLDAAVDGTDRDPWDPPPPMRP